MKHIFLFFIITALYSCTSNSRVKSWGGNASITLPINQKLVVATWKESNLWYLTKPMLATDSANTYTFHEESSFGVLEGTYTIKEVKDMSTAITDTRPEWMKK